MNRFLKLAGLLTLIFLPIYFGAWLYEHYADLLNTIFKVIGVAATVVGVGYLAARAIFGKNWLIKGGAQVALGGDLIQTIQKLLEELPKPKRETIAALGGHLVYRFTRIGLIGLMLALIPIWLLWQQNVMFKKQNVKIDRQNELINTQNTRIDQQTNLIEADRRSSLIFLMSNIMDKVDEEIREQKNQLRENKVPEEQIDTTKFSLSQPLIGRIAALSQAFKPYKYLDGDTLIPRPLSPERSQLLMALTKSNLDSLTLEDVYRNTTFKYADLGGVDLSSVDLRGANLSFANLSFANLSGTYLSGADLIGAYLSYADLSYADLSFAYLSGADLIGADLRDAYLRDAYLREADLSYANLSYANLQRAGLNFADLSYANLIEADLREAYLKNINWLESVAPDAIRKITAQQLLQTKTLKGSKETLPQTIVDSILMIKPELFGEVEEKN